MALVVILGLALPAQADQTAVVELHGNRTAFVDITLRAHVTVDYLSSTFSGQGRFVGFYAENLDRSVDSRYAAGYALGAVKVRDLRTPSAGSITEDLSPDEQTYLEPGRYRLYLLADGPAVVRIVLRNGPRLTLRPTRAAYANVSSKPDITVDPFEAKNTQNLEVRGSRTITLSTIAFGPVQHVFLGSVQACVAKPEGQCGEHRADGGSFPGVVIYPLGQFDMVYGVRYEPGVVRAGLYSAIQGTINTTTIRYASGSAFTLSLV